MRAWNRAAAGLAAATALALAFSLGGCATVKPYEREKLADPIMNPDDPLGKQSVEQKLFSTREAGTGGGSGVGGGCGCAK